MTLQFKILNKMYKIFYVRLRLRTPGLRQTPTVCARGDAIIKDLLHN